jgi:hypothetical protein
MTQTYMDRAILKYLARLTDDQLLLLVRQKVFARITLAQKLKLLEALRQETEVAR